VIRSPATLAVAAAVALAACSRNPAGATAVPPVAPAAGSHAAQAPGSRPELAPRLCEHGVPADQCTRCDPDLVAVFREMGDWCDEHGLPESHCRQCDPDLTFAAATAPKDWCKEHAVPESKCTKCNPSLVATFIQAGDYCREHGFPESVCPRCHPELVRAAGAEPPQFPPPGTRIRIAGEQALRASGIETVAAQARPVARAVEVVGRVGYDQNRLAQLTARGEALVLEVKVDVGDDVKAGQPLAVLTSASVGGNQAQLGSAKARVQAARAALAREEALVERGISARKDVEEARRELAAAEAEGDAARAALAASGGGSGSGGRYVLTAPFAGTVVARDAVAGRSVAADRVLLEVADLSRMWAELDVPEVDAAAVRPGQRVRIRLEALRGAAREGTIARVGSSVDPASRTVRARVELPNADRALKAGLLLRATIDVSDAHDAVLVPRDAVQRADGHSLVFVRIGKGVFDPVAVEVGEASGDAVAVTGVDAGAEVVTTGAFLLKTEILKDSIGAGCCETERPNGPE
jgi:cobalt-zinc-cadmium efflux system membrane fusion protein